MIETPLAAAPTIEAFASSLACVRTQRLDFIDPIECVEAWLGFEGALGMLSDGGPLGRYSYLSCAPDGMLSLGYDDPARADDLLRKAMACIGAPDTGLPPFSGGVAGLASFELGARLEGLERGRFRLNNGDPWPELVLLRYPSVLVFDHHSRTLRATGRGSTDAAAGKALEAIMAAFESAKKTPPQPVRYTPLSGPFRTETPDDRFEADIADLIGQIHAGDLFQANLARGHTGTLNAGVTPGVVMRAILRRGPAPFGGFLRLGNRCILSNSPERFISLSRDGKLETRPIKGTRPRGATPEQDAALAEELLNSEKDRAENLMIVDLMRHDLSRVAVPGSVKVEALNALESYANVHHLVSSVTARLAPDKSVADVITATFPPGSVSGAPKVQALKVIARMEPPRGPYCGSLFFASADGGMDSNVLIRTLALEQGTDNNWHFRLCGGGGIVADSKPHDERFESDAKLSLLKAVLTEPSPYDR